MRAADIGELVTVGDPRVSPDGSTVAVVVSRADLDANAYRCGIWLVPADGPGAPRPFTRGGDARDTKPRWSPDGSRLAFVSHRDDLEGPSRGAQVLSLPVGTGGEAVVVATWPEEVEDLAWSPDGSRLAFVARAGDPATYGPGVRDDRDRPARHITRFASRLDNVGWTIDRPARVHVVPADGGTRPVEVPGPNPDGSDVSGLCWSPDGACLAWAQGVAEGWDRSLEQPLVVAPPPGAPERPVVVAGCSQVSRPAWSPDGAVLAVVTADWSDPPRNGQIALLPAPRLGGGRSNVAAADPCAVADQTALDQSAPDQAAPDQAAPDRAAHDRAAQDPESADLRAVADLRAAEPTVLTAELDRHCASHLAGGRAPVWEGGHLWFQVDDRGGVHLYRVAVNGGATPERMVGGDVVVSGFDVAGGTVAFTAVTPGSAGELYVLDRSTGAERALTRFGASLRVAPFEPEHLSVTTADGESVDAWYLPPTAPDRNATLLNIHGGPFAQYTCAFLDDFAVQAGRGYGVLWCNPRGSSGRAESWARALRGPRCAVDPGSGWGGVDVDDVLAVLDAAVERFDLDASRVGVLGGSYGGYLTSWLIGHTDRFAAACSERAANNLLTLVSTSDIGSTLQPGYVGVSHVEHPEEVPAGVTGLLRERHHHAAAHPPR